MFCFCFQSPSLKLQALESDSGSQSVQENLHLSCESFLYKPPSPSAEDENLVHSVEPDFQSSESTPLTSTVSLSNECSEDDPLSSPGDSSSSPLLSRFTSTDCPVPSPRCHNLSHSLRYNSDPDAAPSSPCSQHIRMARCGVNTESNGGNVSVTVLNRHIHALRKRIRLFEEQFEQEKHYKPAHNDKTANPEVSRLMKDLIRSRKQLKELKLRQTDEAGLRRQRDFYPSGKSCKTNEDHREVSVTGSELQVLNNNGNTKPDVEETVNVISNRMKERRRELGLPDDIKEMNHVQMTMEKSNMQKCLLYFESLHGRPSTRQERTLLKPFYDRYRLLKQILLLSATANVISTIEEEEPSDDAHPKQHVSSQRTLRLKSPRSVSSDESLHLDLSEIPVVSPLEEEKVLQPHTMTMANLHEASRPELLDHLRTARLEKRRLHQTLREFEDQFYWKTGRACQKEDRGPMAEEYCEYKSLKAKLRLLEALLRLCRF
uniref:Family with sequence similarity 13 member C n=1 Tax=Cynoglossus semilaevis TaxID=244447 RepID=A0A3P8UMT6_CYNSE